MIAALWVETPVSAVEVRVEIKEIEDEHLHGGDEHVAAEVVSSVGKALLHHAEIAPAHLLLLRREAHHGVEEEGELPFRAVVALRSTKVYEIRIDIDYLHFEVVRRVHPFYQLALAHNHEVSLAQFKFPPVERKAAGTARAEGMDQFSIATVSIAKEAVAITSQMPQRVGNHNIFLFFHRQSHFISYAKIHAFNHIEDIKISD